MYIYIYNFIYIDLTNSKLTCSFLLYLDILFHLPNVQLPYLLCWHCNQYTGDHWSTAAKENKVPRTKCVLNRPCLSKQFKTHSWRKTQKAFRQNRSISKIDLILNHLCNMTLWHKTFRTSNKQK